MIIRRIRCVYMFKYEKIEWRRSFGARCIFNDFKKGREFVFHLKERDRYEFDFEFPQQRDVLFLTLSCFFAPRNLASSHFLEHPVLSKDANAELGDEVLFYGYFDTK